jgi:WS/DGAT/MGAT family acyltransferase
MASSVSLRRPRGSAGEARPRLALVRNAAERPAPPPSYEWLSAEDRMFLSFEKPTAPMHVGAILLFEPGFLSTSSQGVDVQRIRRYIGAHLHAIPRYRQRLHAAPIDGQPVWIDDDRFDLAQHVRHLRLDDEGDKQALQRLASHILSQPLDRSRPLWEMWVVDGFPDGRFAIFNKMHHCMVDGVAGADLLALLLSPMPDAALPAALPGRWVPRPAPRPSALLRDRTLQLVESAATAVRGAVDVVRHPERAGEWAGAAAALWRTVGLGLWPAPESPFNRPIGRHRRFEWLSIDLGEVKRIKNRLGGTVNDVVLATVAGAVRRLLMRRDPQMPPDDLRALVPVSTRSAADASTLGNHVAAWLLPLPTGEATAAARLSRIGEITAGLKGATNVLGAQMLSEAGCSLIGAGVRLFERLRPFNLVVTNVPGPPLPLYLLGARLQDVHPLVPLFPNQGLGIAVFSYADRLCWGLNADCHVVPDLDALGTAVAESFEELRAAADRGA